MLTVNRENAHTLFLCKPHNKLTAGNKRFLVSKRKLTACIDCGQGRFKSCHTDNAVEHIIRTARRTLANALHTGKHLGRGVGDFYFKLSCRFFVHHRSKLRLEFSDLLLNRINADACRQSLDLIALHLDNLKSLSSD